MRIEKGYLFVIIQFSLLGIIFFTGPNIPNNLFLLIMYIFGIGVGVIAVWNMRASKLRTSPEVANGAVLITNGIYKYIRHPMYLGLILISLSLVLEFFTSLRFIFFLILIINLLAKLSYEEKQLEKHFKEYISYKNRTKKLIPFVF